MKIYEVITAYANTQDAITRQVRESLAPIDELAKAIGIKKTQFYQRLYKSDWRPEEMLILAPVLQTAKKRTIGGVDGL